MSYTTIEFETTEGVAVLRLNRPASLNSFTVEMHLEVRSALAAAASDKAVRAVLLTGNGRGFCAGQDLSDLSSDLSAHVGNYYNPLIRQIHALEKPVV